MAEEEVKLCGASALRKKAQQICPVEDQGAGRSKYRGVRVLGLLPLSFSLLFSFFRSYLTSFGGVKDPAGLLKLSLLCSSLKLANFRMENKYFYAIVIKRINSLFCCRLSPSEGKSNAAALQYMGARK